VKVKEDLQWLLDFSLGLESYNAKIDIKTPFECLKSLELGFTYHQIVSNGGEVVIRYSDQTILLIKAELSKKFLESELLVGVQDTHILHLKHKFENDVRSKKSQMLG